MFAKQLEAQYNEDKGILEENNNPATHFENNQKILLKWQKKKI
jgi:hypothetical protein